MLAGGAPRELAWAGGVLSGGQQGPIWSQNSRPECMASPGPAARGLRPAEMPSPSRCTLTAPSGRAGPRRPDKPACESGEWLNPRPHRARNQITGCPSNSYTPSPKCPGPAQPWCADRKGPLPPESSVRSTATRVSPPHPGSCSFIPGGTARREISRQRTFRVLGSQHRVLRSTIKTHLFRAWSEDKSSVNQMKFLEINSRHHI